MTPMPTFLIWWREVNDHLAAHNHDEMAFGDARYWYERHYSPDTAAALHMEECAA